MNKEKSDKGIAYSPSQELSRYIEDIRSGTNTNAPAYGQGSKGIFDYYGIDPEGNENARFRIPWGDCEKLEKSYHIRRTSSGDFVVTDEDLHPYKG